MDRSTLSIIVLLLVLQNVVKARLASHHSSSDHNRDEKRCEEITVPMCRNIGYNYTSMPNQFHHETQDEAGLEGECVCTMFVSSTLNQFNNSWWYTIVYSVALRKRNVL